MLSVAEVKTRITEVFGQYVTKLHMCESIPHIESPSMTMMQSIVDLIKPDHSFQLIAGVDRANSCRSGMPQDELTTVNGWVRKMDDVIH